MGLSRQLALMSLAAGIAGNFQQGYLTSVLSQPYESVESFINASWIERTNSSLSVDSVAMIMSGLNIISPIAQMIGQMVALYICDRIGRKKTAIYGCLLIFPGCLLSFIAKYCFPAIELLFVGRFIWSLASGILIANQSIWLIEASPVRFRGSVSSMQEVFSALGSLATQAFGVPFSTDELWPFMFIFPMVINIFCIAAFFVVHESPHYLFFKRIAPEKTRKSLAAYHGTADEKIIDVQFDIVKKNGASSADNSNKPKVNGMDIMFRPWKANDDVSKILRHGAWIGLMVKIAFIFTATRVYRAYSTYIINELGGWSYLAARYASLGMSIARIPATMVPVFFCDRIGRRPFLIWSTVATVVALLLIMISIIIGPSWKIGSLIGGLLLQTANGVGLGSISRFYGTEMVPRKLLLKSVSTLAILEALARVVTEFTFYPLAHSMGAYIFIFFIVPTIFFLILMWFCCPETKGKTVNEVLNAMAKEKGINITFDISDSNTSTQSTNTSLSTITSADTMRVMIESEDGKNKAGIEWNTNELKNNLEKHLKQSSYTSVGESFVLPTVVALRQWGYDVSITPCKY